MEDRKTFPKRNTISLGIYNVWAVDLVIISNCFDQNDNYKYNYNILNIVDAFLNMFGLDHGREVKWSCYVALELMNRLLLKMLQKFVIGL